MQRLTGLRARLLATNVTDPLVCTVCRTGVAQIESEEGTLGWTVAGSRASEAQQRLQDRLLLVLGRMLQAARGDEDEPISVSPETMQVIGIAVAVAVSLALVVDLLIFILIPISYWGVVVLPTFAALYIAGAIGFIFVAIHQRKVALGPLHHRPREVRAAVPAWASNWWPLNYPLTVLEDQQKADPTGSSEDGNYLASSTSDIYIETWENGSSKTAVVFYHVQEGLELERCFHRTRNALPS